MTGITGFFRTLSVALALILGLAAPSRLPGDDSKDPRIVVDPASGLFKKVIVCRNGAALHDQPTADKKGEPIPPFLVFHQLKTESRKEDEAGFIRVGTAAGSPLGWIKKENVQDWNTRFVLDPKEPQKDAVFTVFHQKDPTTVYAEYTGTKAGFRTLTPILYPPKNEKDPAFEVAFFGGMPKATTGAATPSADVDLKQLKFEVVFVIDTTGSMTPLIEGTTQVVRQVGEKVAGRAELKGKVRLGLVEYRDIVDGKEDHLHLVSQLTDNTGAFSAALGTLRAKGGGDIAEDVLGGLLLAIEKVGWSETSSKHVILIGDASAHLSGKENSTGKTIKQIIDLGRISSKAASQQLLGSIMFHAVRANQRSAPEDAKTAKQQFQQISQNNGIENGVYAELEDPNSETDRNAVVEALVKQLTKGLDATAKVTDPDAKPVKPEQIPSDAPFEANVYKILNAVKGEETYPLKTGVAKE